MPRTWDKVDDNLIYVIENLMKKVHEGTNKLPIILWVITFLNVFVKSILKWDNTNYSKKCWVLYY